MYIERKIQEYLDDLSAKLPAPGGGSAAALTGAIAAGLLSMVCNFTLGKQKYIQVEAEIKEIFKKSESARKKLTELVDEDVKAFSLKDPELCLNIPLAITRTVFSLAKACPDLSKKGNPNLVSDTSCAIDLLTASFLAARVNVEINLKNYFDKQIKQNIIQELDQSEEELKKIQKEVTEYAGKIIRG